MVTVVVTSLIVAYMLFDPAPWLVDLMQLTDLSINFRVFCLILALGGFACAWIAERKVFLWVARIIGKVRDTLWPQRKKRRKDYKILLEKMRM